MQRPKLFLMSSCPVSTPATKRIRKRLNTWTTCASIPTRKGLLWHGPKRYSLWACRYFTWWNRSQPAKKLTWARACLICCNAARRSRCRLKVSWRIIVQNARATKCRLLCLPTLPRRRTSFTTSQEAFQIFLWAKSTRRQVQHVMILANCTISLFTFDQVVAGIRTQTGPIWWKDMIPCVHDSRVYAILSPAEEFDQRG